MVVRKVPKDNWCVICDEPLSEVEISHYGSLRVFWSLPGDREICLCRDCFAKLKQLVNDFKFEDKNN